MASGGARRKIPKTPEDEHSDSEGALQLPLDPHLSRLRLTDADRRTASEPSPVRAPAPLRARPRRYAQIWDPRPPVVPLRDPVGNPAVFPTSGAPQPVGSGGGRRSIPPRREDFSTTDEERFPPRRRRFLSPHRVLQEVRRWDLSFSGRRGEDVEDFISLVEEGRALVPIQDEDLLKTLSFCLKGDARTWYREARTLLVDWPAAKAAFRERFSDPDYQIALREEISRRTQGDRESALSYLGCMNGLFARLNPAWTEWERVRYAHRNMLPVYRVVIQLHDRLTMRDLERAVARQEQILRSVGTRRAPPRPEASLCPGFAYWDSPERQTTSRRTELRAVQIQDVVSDDQLSANDDGAVTELLHAMIPSRARRSNDTGGRPRAPLNSRPRPTSSAPRARTAPTVVPAETSPLPAPETCSAPAPADRRAPDCWNCRKSGHRHRECQEPRRLFCYRCGLSGVTTARCNLCNQGNAEGGA